MLDPKQTKVIMQVVVTGVLLVFSMYIIVTEKSDSALVKWAIGIIGLIIGYWLK